MNICDSEEGAALHFLLFCLPLGSLFTDDCRNTSHDCLLEGSYCIFKDLFPVTLLSRIFLDCNRAKGIHFSVRRISWIRKHTFSSCRLISSLTPAEEPYLQDALCFSWSGWRKSIVNLLGSLIWCAPWIILSLLSSTIFASLLMSCFAAFHRVFILSVTLHSMQKIKESQTMSENGKTVPPSLIENVSRCDKGYGLVRMSPALDFKTCSHTLCWIRGSPWL